MMRDDVLHLRRTLRRTRLLAATLAALLVGVAVPRGVRWVWERVLDAGLSQVDRSAPHTREIK